MGAASLLELRKGSGRGPAGALTRINRDATPATASLAIDPCQVAGCGGGADFRHRKASIHPETLESTMKSATLRHTLFLAAVLAAAAVAGCAEVHQNPASSTITGQAASGQAQSPTNVPF